MSVLINAFIVSASLWLLTAGNEGVLFKRKTSCSVEDDAHTTEMETYLWMSEFPSKKRLCHEGHCKSLDCKMYKLPANKGWPDSAYYEVANVKFQKLRRWCDWEQDSPDAQRKGLLGSFLGSFKSMLIYPGTRWCGMGNRANHYNDLGFLHSREDACCREHDMCPVFIQAGTCVHNQMAPNLCNNSSVTMSHCDCDRRFQKCLQSLGTPTSYILRKLYFNMLGGRCFAHDGHTGILRTFVLTSLGKLKHPNYKK